MRKQLVVKKFGGTSLGSIKQIQAVAKRITEDYKNGEHPLVVVSAMSGQTSRLIQMAGQMDPSYRGKAYDMLLSSGEQVSLALLSMALEKQGLKTTPLLAFQAGIHTDNLFSCARIRSIDTRAIKKILSEGAIPLIAGFQGVTEENQITTFGRGGSDLTAVALSVVLKRKMCEIYTDVSGVYTGDPRLIPQAGKLKRLGFSEMMEMSSLGSRVLQFRCVELAAKHNLKIHVRCAFKQEQGTWIVNDKDVMENSVVSAVAHDLKTLVVQLEKLPKGPETAGRLFQALGEGGVSVDIISQQSDDSGQRISFSISREDMEKTQGILKSLSLESQAAFIKNVAKISVIGVGMVNHSGVAGRFFSVFQRQGIPFHLVTTSEIKISAVINQRDLAIAAKSLHEEFGLSSKTKS